MYPKIIELGPITLHTYGLLLALAFLAAISLLVRQAESDEVPKNKIWDLGFIVIISALLGAKLLMVLTNFDYYTSQPSQLLSLGFWRSGGAYFGGLLGAIIGSYWYISRTLEMQFWTIADAAAPAIALGQAIGRLGCFGAGCDYGKPSDLPWAVTFTDEYASQNVGVPLDISLHPTQLYESFATLLLCLMLYKIHRSHRFRGQVFAYYMIGYGLIRFSNEFFRGDVGRGLFFDGQVSIHQLISIGLMLVAGVFIFRNRVMPVESRSV